MTRSLWLVLLLLPVPAWAIPITDPAASTCTSSGGAWFAFDVGGTCLRPRGPITPRAVLTPRETITPRVDLPAPVNGGLAGGGGPEADSPLQSSPEPGTLLLRGTALAAGGGWLYRRRR